MHARRYYYRVGDGVTFSSIFNFTTVYAKGARTPVVLPPLEARHQLKLHGQVRVTAP